MKIRYAFFALSTFAVVCFTSCEDFLDKEPLSQISPEKYLWDDAQLASFVTDNYQILPTHASDDDHKYSWGTFANDDNTDVMTAPSMDNKYIPGQWLVGTDGGDWSFSRIQQINYFLETVVPRYEAGELSGSQENCKHYIGEMYFLRAFEYFGKLQTLGDFPIITENYPDDMDLLIAASERAPRTEVARFILSDLDKAIDLMKDVSPDGQKNRLNKACAQLVKSRVALYEGTWLKYFKGTAFVPNGPGWPGAAKDYNANYQFKSGSIDGEIDFFLGEAMSAAKECADAVTLVNNTWQESEATHENNPYFTMFSDEDMSEYPEVLMWRQYNIGLGVTNNVNVYATSNNNQRGTTRSMVEKFLMQDGMPIYASSDYQGDDQLSELKIGRDPRLRLFLKEPGQTNALYNLGVGTHGHKTEPWPEIWQSSGEKKYSTGYTISKGMNYDFGMNQNGASANGATVFRGAEAYLNYIEACYEKNGSLDGVATDYWQQIRERAGMDTDFHKTINNTDMSREVLDWGSYSAGAQIDATLYNIRRERSVELMAEGLREMDLKRWRAMDQLIDNYYHFDGFKLWGPMKDNYKTTQLSYTGVLAKVSSPELSDYLRPYEIVTTNLAYNGAKWVMAHYLNPIAHEHFLVSAVGNSQAGGDVDYSQSPIYQNPGWGIEASTPPSN